MTSDHANNLPSPRLPRALCVLAVALGGLHCDAPALDETSAASESSESSASSGAYIDEAALMEALDLDLTTELDDDETAVTLGGFDPWMYSTKYVPAGTPAPFEGYVYDQHSGAKAAGCAVRTSRFAPLKYYPNSSNPCPSVFEVLPHVNGLQKVRLLSIPNNDGYRYLADIIGVQFFPVGQFPTTPAERWPKINQISGISFKLRALACGGSNPNYMFGRVLYNLNLLSPDKKVSRTISIDLLTTVGAYVDKTKMAITEPGLNIYTEEELFKRAGGDPAKVLPYMKTTYELNAPAYGFGARARDLAKTLQTKPACTGDISTAPEYDVYIPFDTVLNALKARKPLDWPADVTNWNLHYSGGIVTSFEYWGAQQARLEIEMKEHRVLRK